MGVETSFSCQVIFISGRETTKGNMERRINNKKQYEGKKILHNYAVASAFLTIRLLSCTILCQTTRTQGILQMNQHGGTRTRTSEEVFDIVFTNKSETRAWWGFFWRRRSKGNKIVCQLGRKNHFIIFFKFILTTDSDPLSDKLKQHTHNL